MKKNIFLALDFDSLDKALQVTDQTREHVAGIKIGSELYSSIGLKGLKEFEKFKLPIFLDTKIFDIPNQAAKTIKVISEYKFIKYFTIHAFGSLEMLQAAQKIVDNTNLELLAVSVLTSWSQKDLGLVGINNNINDQVKLLIKLACQAKLSGIIASAQNINLARQISKEIKIFCPGIRGNQNTQDQKRTLSYKEFNAIADDKCFAVIGRPIYEGNALENIKDIINSAN
ncbi:orotidine-5'-phosphate decarboxylase [Pelagibacteraceae bacterium]|jgi:orotidine-5'-phosphate decarboxylase|nr:orotidine-5'-phosphate decarboxylase [Pelagibacteraceae bacterium]